MPSKCAVIACSNRADREREKGFHRVPSIIKTQGQQTEELSRKRRAKWFSNISRADLDENKTHIRVCSDHFITGKPSRLYPEESIDWAPTLQLGHNKLKSNTELLVSRHNRNAQRQEKKRISTAVEALLTLPDLTCVGDDDTVVTFETADRGRIDSITSDELTENSPTLPVDVPEMLVIIAAQGRYLAKLT